MYISYVFLIPFFIYYYYCIIIIMLTITLILELLNDFIHFVFFFFLPRILYWPVCQACVLLPADLETTVVHSVITEFGYL